MGRASPVANKTSKAIIRNQMLTRIAPIFGGRVEALGVAPLNKQITGHAIIESLAWGITRIFAPVKKPNCSI